MEDGRRSLAGSWAAAEADGDAASAVLSGEYQALEMSAMVSALAHVVAGGDDDGYPPAAGGYTHATAQQWGSYPSAAAPTPDHHHFYAAGNGKESSAITNLIKEQLRVTCARLPFAAFLVAPFLS
ncbi:hypothetical protein C2845_PM06G20540 [Panicum miliaceum]|uniref:Uncharacterized protein n=1 Tax=Panicum miliaceum TaxID=4540 RepID=A0A3L6R772_PANMI|nr:hypothetical protein C2845_PM06G20540 [Panicum miliaceum]